MERYRMPTPRTGFALAAALATAVTLSVAVLPIRVPADAAGRTMLRGTIEVAIVPGRIEVIGVRTQDAARNDAMGEHRAPANRV